MKSFTDCISATLKIESARSALGRCRRRKRKCCFEIFDWQDYAKIKLSLETDCEPFLFHIDDIKGWILQAETVFYI